jgi:tetratricopeptide (TPR) repeat protein
MEILDMKPGSSAGLMILGDAELALGNVENAKKAYHEAHENASLYLEPLSKLASLAESIGDHEECLGYLEQLDKLSPLNSERKVNMGEINFTLGHEEKAEGLFEAALAQAAKDAIDQVTMLAERVSGIYSDKNPELAERFLRKALAAKQKQLTPADIRIFNQLGISLRQQGKWQEAIEEYKLALKVVPDNAGLYYNLSMAFSEGNLLREARTHMEKAMELNPNLPRTSAGVAYNMGMVLVKSGNAEKAKACLNIALELNPRLEQAKAALVEL